MKLPDGFLRFEEWIHWLQNCRLPMVARAIQGVEMPESRRCAEVIQEADAGSLPDVTQEYAGLDFATQQDMPNRANQLMCPTCTRAQIV